VAEGFVADPAQLLAVASALDGAAAAMVQARVRLMGASVPGDAWGLLAPELSARFGRLNDQVGRTLADAFDWIARSQLNLRGAAQRYLAADDSAADGLGRGPS
jgi:hypothetical protein